MANEELNISKIDEDQLRKLVKAGLSHDQIARAFGISGTTLEKYFPDIGGQNPGKRKSRLNKQQIRKLAAKGCTVEEIADIMGVSKKTLERRYLDVINTGRSAIKVSLRRVQIKRALKGSDTMLVWLGKQMLGQKDKVENEITGKDGSNLFPASQVSNDERAKRTREMMLAELGDLDEEGHLVN